MRLIDKDSGSKGLGPVVPKKLPAPAPVDNEGNTWAHLKPGFDINQKGQIRTKL